LGGKGEREKESQKKRERKREKCRIYAYESYFGERGKRKTRRDVPLLLYGREKTHIISKKEKEKGGGRGGERRRHLI